MDRWTDRWMDGWVFSGLRSVKSYYNPVLLEPFGNKSFLLFCDTRCPISFSSIENRTNVAHQSSLYQNPMCCLLKLRLLGPQPKFLSQEVWDEYWKSAFLVSSLGMLMLVVQGPHSVNPWDSGFRTWKNTKSPMVALKFVAFPLPLTLLNRKPYFWGSLEIYADKGLPFQIILI